MGNARFCALLLIGTSMAVNVQFIRKINKRLQFAATDTDYYFSCSVIGTVLQWGLNSVSLGGYEMDDVGVSTVTNKSSFYVTSTLLSAVPLTQQSGVHFVSVLVISVPKSSTLHLNVSCSNNKDINVINVTINPEYWGPRNGSIATFTNRTIVLQYILSAPLLMNSSVLVHIFMCGTDSLLQLIGTGKRAIGFGDEDDVGAAVSDLSPDNKMVSIQTILISRQPLETTSLVFILSDTSFTVVCSFKSNKVQLLSQEEFPTLNSTDSVPGDRSSNDSQTTQCESPTATTNQNFWTSYYSSDSTASDKVGTTMNMKKSVNLAVIAGVVSMVVSLGIVILLVIAICLILKKRTFRHSHQLQSITDMQELCSHEKQEDRFIGVGGVTTDGQFTVTLTVNHFTDNGYLEMEEIEKITTEQETGTSQESL